MDCNFQDKLMIPSLKSIELLCVKAENMKSCSAEDVLWFISVDSRASYSDSNTLQVFLYPSETTTPGNKYSFQTHIPIFVCVCVYVNILLCGLPGNLRKDFHHSPSQSPPPPPGYYPLDS